MISLLRFVAALRSDFRAFSFFQYYTQNPPPRYFVDFPPLFPTVIVAFISWRVTKIRMLTLCSHRAIHTAVSAATFGKLKGTTSSQIAACNLLSRSVERRFRIFYPKKSIMVTLIHHYQTHQNDRLDIICLL